MSKNYENESQSRPSDNSFQFKQTLFSPSRGLSSAATRVQVKFTYILHLPPCLKTFDINQSIKNRKAN